MQVKNENNTKIIERLSQYIDYQGENFNKLSEKINVSNSYFSKMLKNKANIGEDILRKILLYYESLSPDWLILGNGEMNRTQKNTSISSNCPNCASKDKMISTLEKLNESQAKTIELLEEKLKFDVRDSDASVADVG